MKICLNCQIEFADNLNFCSNCGSKLNEQTRFETLGLEYYLDIRGLGSSIIRTSGDDRYFRVFIFENRIFYIRDFKIISEDILTGEIQVISELNDCTFSEDYLAIFVNSFGVFVYTAGLEYMYFIEHRKSIGREFSSYFSSKKITKVYICNTSIFYQVLPERMKEEIEVTVEGTLPHSITEQNSCIERFDVIQEYTDIILSSIYLPNIYINPTLEYHNLSKLTANDDFLVYGVDVFTSSEDDDCIYPKPHIVIVNLKTKAVEYLDTDFDSDNFLFFDAKDNKLFFKDCKDYKYFYYSVDVKTKIVTKQNEIGLETISYFDGVEFVYVDDSTFCKVDKYGTKSSDWREGYAWTRDWTFMKTNKWLILPNYIGDLRELQVYDATTFERPTQVYKTQLLGV